MGESAITGALPKPPRFLSKDEKKKFRSIVRQLAERRAVTTGDGDLIAIYVTQDSRWQQALVKIRDEGAVRVYQRLGADGLAIDVEKVNLNIAIAKDCERSKVQILTKLGLTPRDKEAVRPTAAPKSKIPEPGTAAAVHLEFDQARAAYAAEQAAAGEQADEPDLNDESLEKLMEEL